VARLNATKESDLDLIYRLIEEAMAQAGLTSAALAGASVRVYLTGLGPRIDAMDYKSFYDKNDIEDVALSASIKNLHVRNMSQDYLAFKLAEKYRLQILPAAMHCTSNSALTAIHLGCQAIERGGLDLVCIINCSKINTQDIWFLENQSMLASKVVQPFGKNSQAVLFAEGCSVMLLERDGYRGSQERHNAVRLKSNYIQTSAGRSHDTGWLSSNLLKVMRSVLSEAAVTPEQLCAIIPHGNGSSTSDKSEAKAISMLVGEQKIPVLAYKGMMGYTATGSGIIDLIIGAEALRKGELIPAVANDEISDEISHQLLVNQPVMSHQKLHLLKTGLGVDGSIIGVVISLFAKEETSR
jgi:3-oxoacyl-(acyl-carrier-protein) synthase